MYVCVGLGNINYLLSQLQSKPQGEFSGANFALSKRRVFSHCLTLILTLTK